MGVSVASDEVQVPETDDEVSVLESNSKVEEGSSAVSTRPGSPEVLQITKSIPEDCEVKITLTKSPSKDSCVKKSLPNTQENDDDDDDVESISVNDEDEEESCEILQPSSPVFKKKSRNREKFSANIDLSSESDKDSDNLESSSSSIDLDSVRRSSRSKKFSSLSEIDKAKLKNRPFAEREQAYKELATKSIDCCDTVSKGTRRYQLSSASSRGKLNVDDIPRSKKAEIECVDIDEDNQYGGFSYTYYKIGK